MTRACETQRSHISDVYAGVSEENAVAERKCVWGGGEVLMQQRHVFDDLCV